MWYTTLLFYFSAIPAALSLLFMDVGTFSFKETGEKGIRIIVFDTEKQQLTSVDYIPLRNPRLKEKTAFRHAHFSTDFLGHVTLSPSFHPATMAVRTFGKIHNKHQVSTLPPCTHPLTPLKRMPLQKKGKASVTITFHGTHGPEKRNFSSLCASANANKIERGRLGETVTDLTFLSLGFHKINGQNASNQGLDGIFWHAHGNFLVLTESKCRSESKRAQRYLEDDLAEAKIVARLREIKDPTLQKTLFHQMDTHADHTQKMAQRLTASGFMESALSPLNPILYFYARYPHMQKAPLTVKKRMLTSILKALGLSKAEAVHICNHTLSEHKANI
ncbi:hypothetical protein EIL50_00400 [bacterium NHP-B]|nr:hypothetical protein EIL50_00400 [bacterium NHP-B]